MVEGMKTKDGVVRAFDEFLLVTPYNDSSEVIVVQFGGEEPQKGTIVDIGECVPNPLSPGDLVYFINGFKLEKELMSVHYGNILAFSKLQDD